MDIKLTFSDSDLNEFIHALENVCENIPALLPSIAKQISKSMLKDVKARWNTENHLRATDLSQFRSRLEIRWDKALGELDLLQTMSMEWCQNISKRIDSRKNTKDKHPQKILVRLLVRACQVTGEILCLLENGFADGAMARWRTLHEIAVVAAVIHRHGEDIAERYLNHQAVESKRAMDKYLVCSAQLGYKPLSVSAQAKIDKAYGQALANYGKPFKSDYGWAAFHHPLSASF